MLPGPGASHTVKRTMDSLGWAECRAQGSAGLKGWWLSSKEWSTRGNHEVSHKLNTINHCIKGWVNKGCNQCIQFMTQFQFRIEFIVTGNLQDFDHFVGYAWAVVVLDSYHVWIHTLRFFIVCLPYLLSALALLLALQSQNKKQTDCFFWYRCDEQSLFIFARRASSSGLPWNSCLDHISDASFACNLVHEAASPPWHLMPQQLGSQGVLWHWCYCHHWICQVGGHSAYHRISARKFLRSCSFDMLLFANHHDWCWSKKSSTWSRGRQS